MNGVIVGDKPKGWTSHDVVNRMRRLADTKKVGHLGTLDPLATGVLPLLLNRATRLAQFFVSNDKRYTGTIRFGWSTSTYDADGEISSPKTDVVLDPGRLAEILARFQGEFDQTPPPVSAKKIAGRPAYELARKNVEFQLEPVRVTVHSLELISVEGSAAVVKVHCGAGTYLRSIAHDAGQALGCGAFLETLRRTASGGFDETRARTLEELERMAAENRLVEALIPAAELLPELPVEIVDQITETQIRQGRDFRTSPFRNRGTARLVKAVSRSGELIAIGEARLPNIYHPILVL
jgi:tRNA pseudouridine55 synthase